MSTLPMDSIQSEDTLSRALHEWRVTPVRNPQFRAEVWRRIAGAPRRGALPWTQYVRRHAGAVVGALAIAAALGAWIGREQAHTRVASDRTRLANAYVQALDARAMHLR